MHDGGHTERKAASAPVLPALGRQRNKTPLRRLHSGGRGNVVPRPPSKGSGLPRPPSKGSGLPRFARQYLALLDERDNGHGGESAARSPTQRVADYNAVLLNSIAKTRSTDPSPSDNSQYVLERGQRLSSDEQAYSDDSIDSIGADSIEDEVFDEDVYAASIGQGESKHKSNAGRADSDVEDMFDEAACVASTAKGRRESNPVQLQSVEPSVASRQGQMAASAVEMQVQQQQQQQQASTAGRIKTPNPSGDVRANKLPPKAAPQQVTESTLAADDDIDRSSTKIRVCVRKRPLGKKEKRRNDIDVVEAVDRATCCINNNKVAVDMTSFNQQHKFVFDEMFSEKCLNEEIYTKTAQPLIKNVLAGCMATCFAYGQTGAGKTHTMMGIPGKIDGLYALGAKELIHCIQTDEQYSSLQVMVSFYEIYCGKLYDLLDKRKELFAREDGVGRIHIRGIERVQVHEAEDIMNAIERGNRSRITGQTGANDTSSRSHAVVQLELNEPHTRMARGRRAGEETFRLRGRLCFIDLAGSERASDTSDNDKQRRMEGAEINTSLLALKECIRGLDADAVHVPFRQSKLTMVLKDSFVGNSRTCMIACVAPGLSSCEHSLNTLRYADRVKELGGSGNSGSTVVSDRRRTNTKSASKSAAKRGKKKSSTKKKKAKARPQWNDEVEDQRPGWNNDINDNHDGSTTENSAWKTARKKSGRTPRPSWNGDIADHRDSRSRQKNTHTFSDIKVDAFCGNGKRTPSANASARTPSADAGRRGYGSAPRSAESRNGRAQWNAAIIDHRGAAPQQSNGGGSRQTTPARPSKSRQTTPARPARQVTPASSAVRVQSRENTSYAPTDSYEATPAATGQPASCSESTHPPTDMRAKPAAAAAKQRARQPVRVGNRSRPQRRHANPEDDVLRTSAEEPVIIWPNGEDYGRPPRAQQHQQNGAQPAVETEPNARQAMNFDPTFELSRPSPSGAHHGHATSSEVPGGGAKDAGASLWPKGMDYADDQAAYNANSAPTPDCNDHAAETANDAQDSIATTNLIEHTYSTLASRATHTPTTLVGRDPINEAKEALIASLWPEGEGDFTDSGKHENNRTHHTRTVAVSPRSDALQGHTSAYGSRPSSTHDSNTPAHVRAQRKKWARPDNAERLLMSPSIHVDASGAFASGALARPDDLQDELQAEIERVEQELKDEQARENKGTAASEGRAKQNSRSPVDTALSAPNTSHTNRQCDVLSAGADVRSSSKSVPQSVASRPGTSRGRDSSASARNDGGDGRTRSSRHGSRPGTGRSERHSRPGTRNNSRSDSRPASRSGSQPGSRPGSRGGSRRADTRPPSVPAADRTRAPLTAYNTNNTNMPSNGHTTDANKHYHEHPARSVRGRQ